MNEGTISDAANIKGKLEILPVIANFAIILYCKFTEFWKSFTAALFAQFSLHYAIISAVFCFCALSYSKMPDFVSNKK